MRKIIIALIMVVILVFTGVTVVNGIQIGNFEILGISKVKQKNDDLDTTVKKATKLASTDYQQKVDELNSALKKLVSQSAVNLEIDNTDSIDGIIDAIIKANDNLTDSNTRNDWEMMGEDIKKLQDLINLLDKMRENNSKKKTENVTTDTNEITTEKIYE